MATYYKYSGMPYRIIMPDGTLGDAVIPDGIVGCRQDRFKVFDDLMKYKNASHVFSSEEPGVGWVCVFNDVEITDPRFVEVDAQSSDGEIRHALFLAKDELSRAQDEVDRIPEIVKKFEGDRDRCSDNVMDLNAKLAGMIAAGG